MKTYHIYSQLKAHTISLISGILLSISLGIPINILTSGKFQNSFLFLMIASTSLFVSAIYLYLTSPILEEIHRLWHMANNEPQSWNAIVDPYINKLNKRISISLVSFFVFLASLVVAVIFQS